MVTQRALLIAKNLNLSQREILFIEQASLLHDIGICRVSMDKNSTGGKLPYICHGLEGQKILDELGYRAHGLVCRNHIGVGLTKKNITNSHLPLPLEDMTPTTEAQRIITYADIFFSKSDIYHPRTLKQAKKKISSYGSESLKIFENMIRDYSVENSNLTE